MWLMKKETKLFQIRFLNTQTSKDNSNNSERRIAFIALELRPYELDIVVFSGIRLGKENPFNGRSAGCTIIRKGKSNSGPE